MNKERKIQLHSVLKGLWVMNRSPTQTDIVNVMTEQLSQLNMLADMERKALHNIPDSFSSSTKVFDRLSDNVEDFCKAVTTMNEAIILYQSEHSYEKIKPHVKQVVFLISNILGR